MLLLIEERACVSASLAVMLLSFEVYSESELLRVQLDLLMGSHVRRFSVEFLEGLRKSA